MIFENKSDLNREEYAINKFVAHMSQYWHRFKDCTCVKLGRFDLDYIIQFNNGKKITVEIKGVKQHKIESNHIPVVSVAKVEKMQKSVNCDGFNASFIIFPNMNNGTFVFIGFICPPCIDSFFSIIRTKVNRTYNCITFY